MAAINFPGSPSTGDVYSQNGQSWTYDGAKWVSGGTYAASSLTPRYQQGLWTPTPSQGSITTANARWSRIGNQVTIQANLRGFTNTSSNDDIAITGVPYTRVTDLFAIGSMRTGCLNYGHGRTVNSCLMATNEVRVGVSIPSVDGTAATAASYTPYTNFITASQADTQLVFTITYFTDDTTWTPINGATVS